MRDLPPARRVFVLPWHQPLLENETRICAVRTPAIGEPQHAAMEPSFAAAGAGIHLAGIVRRGRPDGLVVTVQAGQSIGTMQRGQAGGLSASMLSLVLPWVHAIAAHAVGDAEGLRPRPWLTNREAEVLERLIEGQSVNQIAKELERSPYTVHDHVKSLHRKLGVRRRAALVRCATTGVAPP